MSHKQLIAKHANVIIYTFLLLLSVVVLCQSPLAPYSKNYTGNDSSIFITIAKKLLEGDILYKDITDHKGPMIFIMDALGLFLFKGKLIGIWILEVISLFITNLFIYKTANILFNKTVSLISSILSSLFVVTVLQGGNLSEEWALPYIAIGLYIFTYNISRRQIFSAQHLFILSFTFIMAFLFKASYIGIWCAFGLIIIIQLIFEKKWATLSIYLMYVLFFCALSLFPFLLYFYHHDILHEAYYWMIEFNTIYGNTTDIATTLQITGKTILGVRYLPFIVVATLLYAIIKKDYKKNRTLFGGYTLSILLTAYSCSIGNLYEHYNIIFMPLLVLTYGYLINILSIDTNYKRWAILMLIIGNGYTMMNLKQAINLNYRTESTYTKSAKKVIELIQKHSKEGNTIMGDKYFNRAIYVYANRKCINKYLSNFHSPDISQEAITKKPDIIVSTSLSPLNDTILSSYKLVDKYNHYKIYTIKK